MDPPSRPSHAIAGDALVELGEYEAAAQAYARIAGLDGPQGADSRLAYLQFLKGDPRRGHRGNAAGGRRS